MINHLNTIQHYYQLCEANGWQADTNQIEALETLEKAISPDHQTWRAKIRHFLKRAKHPYGVYLYGDVGRGKTLVMDLFFQHTPLSPKKRWHFAEFMDFIHHRLKEAARLKQAQSPIDRVIYDLTKKTKLICLDELQITEIGDAMLVSRLFTGLTEGGVKVVFTSNLAPEELYKGGLHYDRFYPFVHLIQNNFKTFHLNNQDNQDYRLQIGIPQQCLFTKEDPDAWQKCEDLFIQLTNTTTFHPAVLEVNQRKIAVPKTTKTAAWIPFHDLCGIALGPSDYLALARQFTFLFLMDVPQLTNERKNEARRFISLIDTWYDQNRLLVAYLATDPDKLFQLKGTTLPINRTLSRLKEMQAPHYWERVPLP